MTTKEQKRAYKAEIATHKRALRSEMATSNRALTALQRQIKKLQAECVKLTTQAAERVDKLERRIGILKGRI